jgi:hypothetical protein
MRYLFINLFDFKRCTRPEYIELSRSERLTACCVPGNDVSAVCVICVIYFLTSILLQPNGQSQSEPS